MLRTVMGRRNTRIQYLYKDRHTGTNKSGCATCWKRWQTCVPATRDDSLSCASPHLAHELPTRSVQGPCLSPDKGSRQTPSITCRDGARRIPPSLLPFTTVSYRTGPLRGREPVYLPASSWSDHRVDLPLRGLMPNTVPLAPVLKVSPSSASKAIDPLTVSEPIHA